MTDKCKMKTDINST